MPEEPIQVRKHYLTRVQTSYIRTRKDIPVKLETYDDGEILADFEGVNAWGEGYSDEEALEALREDIVKLFIDLKNTPEDSLLGAQLRQLVILQEYLEEVEI